MATNDKVLLDQILIENQNRIAPEMSESDFFELFVAEQLLKSYGLSYEEIEAGIIGGGNDGGIDGIYVFVEDELVSTDSDFSDTKGEVNIDLVLIQAKRSNGYTAKAIEALISSVHDLLNLETDVSSFSNLYSSELLSIVNDFRNAYRSLITKFPRLRIRVSYVSKGDTAQVHPSVEHRVTTLEEKISEHFSEFDFSFQFLGARELLDTARKQSAGALELRVVETLAAENGSYICLARLSSYYQFITDIENKRRQTIFAANVREYEGSVEVNRGIRETLQEAAHDVDFWWLNNGVTIVADKAPLSGKSLTLENPKVVNGLQTSQEIFKHFSTKSSSQDERLILIRVIVTRDESTRNRIIKATNSQSRISAYSLRATEQIHHDIEQHLSFSGLFYDRQKNYYKNLGKPRKQIVSIQYVAQSVASILLRRPNDSRGRPTNLLKDSDTYKSIFNERYPIDLYLKSVRLMRLVDTFLKTRARPQISAEYTNLRFQLAMYISCILAGTANLDVNTLTNLVVDNVDDEMLSMSAEATWKVFSELKSERELDSDRVAKNRDFDKRLLEKAKQDVDVRQQDSQ